MPKTAIRLILFLLVWTSTLAGLAAPVCAADSGSGLQVQDQTNQIDLSKIQGFIDQLDQETRSYFPQLDLPNLLQNLKNGKVDFRPQAIFSGILKLLFKEVVASAALMAKLVILAVLVGVLQNLQNAFEGNVGRVAQTMSYLVLIAIALASLSLAINTGQKAIDDMVSFMQALLPVLLTLLVAMGNVTTAALFHPFILASLSFISSIIKDIVFPLVFLGAVLAVVNQISDQIKVSRLAALLNSAGKIALGLCLTVFIGIMSVEGVAGSVTDGVALRSAKFATDTFVPVVGRWFSDAVELVISSAVLLKNAIGLVGIIVVVLICLIPVVKIVSIMIIYRLSAALVQPLGNSSLADALQSMSSSLTMIFACVASVGLMFLLAVSIILATSNFTVMLR